MRILAITQKGAAAYRQRKRDNAAKQKLSGEQRRRFEVMKARAETAQEKQAIQNILDNDDVSIWMKIDNERREIERLEARFQALAEEFATLVAERRLRQQGKRADRIAARARFWR